MNYPRLWRDVVAALSPIAAGFGLAVVVDRRRRREASVTNITHSPTPSM